MREDMMLGACERVLANGVWKELVFGERFEAVERERSIVEILVSRAICFVQIPWDRQQHSEGQTTARGYGAERGGAIRSFRKKGGRLNQAYVEHKAQTENADRACEEGSSGRRVD